MKNLAIVALIVFGLSGCKKDRTCTCTDPDGDQTIVKYTKVRKKDVRDDCLTRQVTSVDGRTGVSFSPGVIQCELD